MSGQRTVPIGFLLLFLAAGAPGQTPDPSSGPPRAELRKPTGADEERAKRLDEQIDRATKDDR